MPKYYSRREIFLRMIWGFVNPIFFRFSPRIFYGWRNFLLRMMGATIGKKVEIFPSVDITCPWRLTIGDRSVIAWGVKVYNIGQITIGSDTVISQYSHLCGGSHDYESKDFVLLRTGLTIGNHVWIAADAFIGPGVSVKDGALVGARAVVLRDVPEQKLVAGNPAVVVKDLEASARL